MRPNATFLLLPALLLAACSDDVTPAVDASANDLGTRVDVPAVDVPAVDVPAVDVPAVDVGPVDVGPVDVTTLRDAGADVPALTYEVLPYLSPSPVRRFATPPTPMLLANHDYRALVATDVGTMTIDLFEDETPTTVNSFVWLARNHFFEGIAFHRVIAGFVAQGGDPNTVDGGRNTWGTGGPGYNFGLEVTDDLNFDAPGVVGMARSNSPNTNGSQFYITLAATPNLDQMYTVFGRVIDAGGFTTLTRIAEGEPPVTPTRITSVTILAAPR